MLTQKHREVLLQTASVYDGLSSELFALTKILEDIPNYDTHSKLYSLVRTAEGNTIETKRYLDVIESIMLTNDSGLLCSVLQTTEMGDCDCTEFYLMQPESLSVWAKDRVKSNT